jgi:hypothetical protein
VEIYLKSLAQLRQWEVGLHISTTELPLEFSNKVVKEDWNLQLCQICPQAQSCISSKPKEGKSVGWIEVLLQSRNNFSSVQVQWSYKSASTTENRTSWLSEVFKHGSSPSLIWQSFFLSVEWYF